MKKDYPKEYLSIIRLYNSLLIECSDSINKVTKSLFGVQSQNFNSSAFAFAVRTNNCNFLELHKQLKEMKLIRIWGFRTTIHIYNYDDWELVLSHVSYFPNWYSKKKQKQGISIEPLIENVCQIIKDRDCFTRKDLVCWGLDNNEIGSWGDILIELNNRGLIFHYFHDNKKMFGNVEMFLSKKINIPKYSNNEKLKIIDRYFSTYAPATLSDFAHWLGISIKEAKCYMNIYKENLISIYCDNKEYYIKNVQQKKFDKLFLKYQNYDKYILLPKFDPLLLAYHDKTWLCNEDEISRIWRVAGQVEGVIIKKGMAIATWKYYITINNINFKIFPFNEKLDLNKLNDEFEKIASFFQKSLGKIEQERNNNDDNFSSKRAKS